MISYSFALADNGGIHAFIFFQNTNINRPFTIRNKKITTKYVL